MKDNKVVNIAAVPHRSPFRYPGGKTWLVPRIRAWLLSLPTKPHELAEPFAGGAIVGLSAVFEDLVKRLVLVEMDEDVGAVWQVLLTGSAEKLGARIVDFDVTLESVKAVLDKPSTTILDRAFATIVRNRMQRGGIMAEGASLMKKGENGRGLKSRWYADTLRKRIEAIGLMRERIGFIAGDGIQFIRYNAHRPETVFFIDPPYTVAGRRLYTHSDVDHEKLFRAVAQVRGDFLMTYDNAAEIRALAKASGFDTHLVSMKNTHHEVMRELLIGRDLDWARRGISARVSDSQIALSLVGGQR
jgi:DNA adenine methylase